MACGVGAFNVITDVTVWAEALDVRLPSVGSLAMAGQHCLSAATGAPTAASASPMGTRLVSGAKSAASPRCGGVWRGRSKRPLNEPLDGLATPFAPELLQGVRARSGIVDQRSTLRGVIE